MKKLTSVLIVLFTTCTLFSQPTHEWTELKPETYGFNSTTGFSDSRTVIYTNRNNTGFWFYQDWSGKPVFKSADNKSYILPGVNSKGDKPIIIDDEMAFFISPIGIVWHKPDENKVNLLGASKGSVGDVNHAIANDSCLFIPYMYKDSCRISSVNFKSTGNFSHTERTATMYAKNMTIYPSGNSFLINGDYLYVYLGFNEGKDATLADYVYTFNLKTKAHKKIKTTFDDFSNLANINNKATLIKSSGKAFSINPFSGQLQPVPFSLKLAKNEWIKKVRQEKEALIILTNLNINLSKDNGKSFTKIAPPKIPESIIEDARTNGSVVYLYVSVGDDLQKRLFVRNL